MILKKVRLRALNPLLMLSIGMGVGSPMTRAQLAAAPSVSPADLVKYDKNKNGRLDADEIAARQADQAKPMAVGSSASSEEKVVELSPFEVNAGEDTGYAASSTLAGTRLNSKLEDISGSVSVVTKEQLLDTAAIDLNDIFLYETGTEGTGQFTDMSNDGRGDYDNVQGTPTAANRMRGLAQANIAVGGFTASSSIPIDTYNIQAVEIARGPNSNLAGLSDAGGTVNLVTSKANLTRQTTNFVTRVDSYGGYRASIDLNRPIIQKKLSLRFSAVYNEQGYVRKPSVDRTNRQQFALTYRPFKGTQISASYERFHEFAQRANAISPRDTISIWRERGSPTWDPIAHAYTVNGVTTVVTTTSSASLPTGLSYIGSASARVRQWIDNGTINFMMHGSNPNNPTLGLSSLQQFTQSSNQSTGGVLYKISGTTDKSVYDWTDINLAAPNYEIQSAKISNVTLDQSLLSTQRQRFDVNLAWRREDQNDYRRMFIAQQDGIGNTLEVDTNSKLLDGRPNPFFLHPFIGGVNPQVNKRPVFNDNYRWQAAYQLDLTHESNILKWLGLHRAIAYQEYRLNIASPGSHRYHDTVYDNPDFQPGLLNLLPTTNLAGNNGALTYPAYYFGTDARTSGVTYANTGPVNANGKYTASYVSATSTAYNTADPVTLQEVYFAIGTQKKKIRTSGGNIQSFFLNNQIVTNFGLRKDRVYTEDNLPLNRIDGYFDESNLFNFGRNKRYRQGQTRSKGVVIKPFRGFSGLANTAQAGGFMGYLAEALRGFNLNLNKSNAFQPADTAYNLFLQELPNPLGTSKEIGFTVNMFDKFSLRLTHHDTLQIHTRANTGTIATRALGIDFHPGGQNLSFNLYDSAIGWETALNPTLPLEQVQELAAKRIGYTADYIANAGGKSISDASDAQSTGWELELQFNPTRYWTVKATGSKQQAVDSNISLFIQQFTAQRLPTWTTIKVPTTLLPDGSSLPNAGELWWTLAQGSQGMPVSYYTGNVYNALNLLITNQGKPKPQTREYSFNVITNFQLAGLTGLADSHSWIKNTSVGGSYRWADQAAIGFLGAAPDADGQVRTLDRTKPVFDKARGNLSLLVTYNTKLFNDRIRARFQLNVQNVNESGHLQAVAVNPDGSPWQYRIIDPRQFILTASFDL